MSMSAGSREAAVRGAGGAARAVPTASKTSERRQPAVLMVIPSALILSAPLPVEKLIPTAYNSPGCLSLRAVAWYKEFLPVVLFYRKGRRWAVRTKEILNGLRDRRAVHRHKRHRLRGCLSGGLHTSAQG